MNNPEESLLLAYLSRRIKDYIIGQLFNNQLINITAKDRRQEVLENIDGAREFLLSDDGGIFGFDFICRYFDCDPDAIRDRIQSTSLDSWKRLYHSQAWTANVRIGSVKEKEQW